MKKKINKFFAITLAACMFFSMAACNQEQGGNENSSVTGNTADAAYSYLAIDINPSIEIVVLDDKVVTVKACNEDAAILLSGEDFTGMTVEEVSQSIVELAEDLGYLTEENYDVKITVSADNEDVCEKIKDFATKGAQKGSDLAKINNAPRSADERKVKELQAEDAEKYKDLNPAKIRLIEAIMVYDETMTYEIGASMKVSELADLLEDYAETYGDIVGEELEALFEKTWKGFKDSAKDKIAEQYGEEYKLAWERYVALEKVAKEIEHKAKNVAISEEDMQAIMSLLGIKEDIGGDFEIDPDFFPDMPEDWEDLDSEEEFESDEEVDSEEVDLDEAESEEVESDEFAPEEWDSQEEHEDRPPFHGDRMEKKNESQDHDYENGKGYGDWNVKDYDDYFDKHHYDKWGDDAFEDIEEQIEAILEKYDEDNYVLTEEDLTAIATAWGEEIELVTFEDLEDFLEAEKEKLEEMRKAAEESLRAEDKLAIEIMEETSKQWQEKAFEEIKKQVKKAQEEWKALKEEKKGNK